MFGSSTHADLVASVNVALDWGLALGPMMPFVPSVTPDVNSISVTMDAESIGSLSLEFTAWDTKAQDFAYLDDTRLAVNNRIQLTIGNSTASDTLFYGTIVSHDASISQSGVSLSITAYDVRHTLRRGRFRRTFVAKTPLEIAETVVKDRGLKCKVTKGMPAPTAIPARRSSSGSDYEFVTGLLSDYGYRMDVEGDTIQIRQPSSKPTTPLGYVTFAPPTMMSFSARNDVTEQIDGVIVLGFNRDTQEQVIGTAGKTKKTILTTPSVITRQAAVDTAADASKIAQNILDGRNRNNISASLKCVGDATLVPGTWIKVSEVGPYSGEYRVVRATHSWNPSGGYTTDVSLEQEAA